LGGAEKRWVVVDRKFQPAVQQAIERIEGQK